MTKRQDANLLNYHEAAAFLGISRPTLERRVREGSIRCYKIGNLVRFAPEHLDEYLATNERPVVKRRTGGARSRF